MVRSYSFALTAALIFAATSVACGSDEGPAASSSDAGLTDSAAADGTPSKDGLSDGAPSKDGLSDAALSDTGGGPTPIATPPTTHCPKALPTPKTGTCDVTKGSATKVIRGTVLAPDQVYVGGEVVIDDKGKMVCVGCDCSTTAGYADATALSCGGATITPALINTHDHITFAHNTPKKHTARYDHRHEWRTGNYGKPKISVTSAPKGASNAVPSWGELRFVLGGAASTVGSGGVNGMLRNLDRNEPQQGGLNKKPVEFDTFPLGDSKPQKPLPTTCTYKISVSSSDLDDLDSFLPHVSEGIEDSAHNEFDCTDGINAQANFQKPKTALIHAIGLKAADAFLAAQNGVSVIWSPRSNIDLYGFTANVAMYSQMGINLALGTDWSASGSMNLLRELACADEFNQNNLGGFFSEYQLWRMVTQNAAAAVKMGDVLGQIAVGRPADIAIFAADGQSPYAAVVRAKVESVALVLRGGVALHGDAALVDAMSPDGGAGCEALAECLAGKKVCAKRELGFTVAQLEKAIGTPYPLYFCGQPKDEPSCIPSRQGSFTGVKSADDSDGDGIPNATDLCPKIFSAIRPMDKGVQADVDGDKVGDGCDPCPLTADSNNCAVPTPPVVSDAGGSDTSSGDTSTADTGPALPPKPVSVPEAQTAADGTAVEIKGVCITAIRVGTTGTAVWTQDPNLSEFAGMVVYSKPNVPVKIGDMITASGVMTTFNGLREITIPTVTVTGVCPKAITAITVLPELIATDGTKMMAYMSMLVQVDNVKVVDEATGAKDDFVVTGDLHISPYIYAFDATQYKLDSGFAKIRGVLDFYKDSSKVDPINAGDLVEE